MKWEYIFTKEQELSSDFAKQINSVYLDSFGQPSTKPWSVEDIKKKYRNSDLLTILQEVNKKEIFGYSFYCVPINPLFDNTHILWNNATALRKKVQGKGHYSLVFFQEIINKFPYKIGWAGGRSQNNLIYTIQ